MTFLDFWRALNVALTVRDEPEALYGEAREWFDWRSVKKVDERLVNRVVNSRLPVARSCFKVAATSHPKQDFRQVIDDVLS